ncbi:unnamed protein product [Phytomonas sp. EM1]|nr:unnamed protein product [Phytomonas sp. EM1]|eukprot:CCW65443.1 unnamed protein product [Phytomonas sp. isolate EM1]
MSSDRQHTSTEPTYSAASSQVLHTVKQSPPTVAAEAPASRDPATSMPPANDAMPAAPKRRFFSELEGPGEENLSPVGGPTLHEGPPRLDEKLPTKAAEDHLIKEGALPVKATAPVEKKAPEARARQNRISTKRHKQKKASKNLPGAAKVRASSLVSSETPSNVVDPPPVEEITAVSAPPSAVEAPQPIAVETQEPLAPPNQSSEASTARPRAAMTKFNSMKIHNTNKNKPSRRKFFEGLEDIDSPPSLPVEETTAAVAKATETPQAAIPEKKPIEMEAQNEMSAAKEMNAPEETTAGIPPSQATPPTGMEKISKRSAVKSVSSYRRSRKQARRRGMVGEHASAEPEATRIASTEATPAKSENNPTPDANDGNARRLTEEKDSQEREATMDKKPLIRGGSADAQCAVLEAPPSTPLSMEKAKEGRPMEPLAAEEDEKVEENPPVEQAEDENPDASHVQSNAVEGASEPWQYANFIAHPSPNRIMSYTKFKKLLHLRNKKEKRLAATKAARLSPKAEASDKASNAEAEEIQSTEAESSREKEEIQEGMPIQDNSPSDLPPNQCDTGSLTTKKEVRSLRLRKAPKGKLGKKTGQAKRLIACEVVSPAEPLEEATTAVEVKGIVDESGRYPPAVETQNEAEISPPKDESPASPKDLSKASPAIVNDSRGTAVESPSPILGRRYANKIQRKKVRTAPSFPTQRHSREVFNDNTEIRKPTKPFIDGGGRI